MLNVHMKGTEDDYENSESNFTPITPIRWIRDNKSKCSQELWQQDWHQKKLDNLKVFHIENGDMNVIFQSLTHDEKMLGWVNTIQGPPSMIIILVTKMRSFIGSIWVHTITNGFITFSVHSLNNTLHAYKHGLELFYISHLIPYFTYSKCL